MKGARSQKLKLNILEHLSKILHGTKTKRRTQLSKTLRLPAALNTPAYERTRLGPDGWAIATTSIPVCLPLIP